MEVISKEIIASLPNAVYLQKEVVEPTIKKLVDEKLFWEPKLSKQTVSGLTVLSYKDMYVDIETPNDEARGRSALIEPNGRAPIIRSEGGLFPYTGISEIEEDVFKLQQFALAIPYTEEELKFTDKVNQVLKKHEKLGNQFGSYINQFFGNKISGGWVVSPSNGIQTSGVASGKEWNVADFSAKPYVDILAAKKKIEMVPGHDYTANTCLVSEMSFYDLELWSAEKDFTLQYGKPTDAVTSIRFMGVDILPTDMVKDTFAMMGDLKKCGILYESEPFATKVVEFEKNRTFEVQATRRMNFNLTDPKAICLLTNVASA
jgi:hypothetical protein